MFEQLDELLRSSEFEDFGRAYIARVESDGHENVDFSINIAPGNDNPTQTWLIRCCRWHDYRVRAGFFDQIDISTDHPLLLEYEAEEASLYFRGEPTNADDCEVVLRQVHGDVFGEWVPFSRYVSGVPSKALVGRFGLLAKGPSVLIDRYAGLLPDFGVIPAIADRRRPVARFMGGQMEERRKLKLLLFRSDSPEGSSFVIGESLECERQA